MKYKYIYTPVFRSRQQENSVLTSFDFGDKILPLVEIIKEGDRVLKNGTPQIYIQRYKKLLTNVNSKKILLDLPVYLRVGANTNQEVIRFFRGIISNLQRRIDYYNNYITLNRKIIPVISSLTPQTGQTDTIIAQFNALSPNYQRVAFRLFLNDFQDSINEIRSCIRETDIIIYDIHTSSTGNPSVITNSGTIYSDFRDNHRILIRSAINTEIQNVDLVHGRIVGAADNSLLTSYKRTPLKYNSFGDFVGIKKDDITEGGSISPGFIIYDPIDNVFYGYRYSGDNRELNQFEITIIPSVLNSQFMQELRNHHNHFLSNNPGYDTLENIHAGNESGRNQAKFKKISMEHYLHCIKTLIDRGEL